jgi:hypothetical protein
LLRTIAESVRIMSAAVWSLPALLIGIFALLWLATWLESLVVRVDVDVEASLRAAGSPAPVVIGVRPARVRELLPPSVALDSTPPAVA